ncbi:hypothetical protein EV421DRAFT_282909 [Armillaria borealis]|uniref:Uncharacterized protein n=1 Tax=Armillaria borealis TaxID=47425 RepID=A0AA39IVF0_9AGAR|nr:hypothetical protein EV421DRAFT_282909 [Armillaria borealis]
MRPKSPIPSKNKSFIHTHLIQPQGIEPVHLRSVTSDARGAVVEYSATDDTTFEILETRTKMRDALLIPHGSYPHCVCGRIHNPAYPLSRSPQSSSLGTKITAKFIGEASALEKDERTIRTNTSDKRNQTQNVLAVVRSTVSEYILVGEDREEKEVGQHLGPLRRLCALVPEAVDAFEDEREDGCFEYAHLCHAQQPRPASP